MWGYNSSALPRSLALVFCAAATSASLATGTIFATSSRTGSATMTAHGAIRLCVSGLTPGSLQIVRTWTGQPADVLNAHPFSRSVYNLSTIYHLYRIVCAATPIPANIHTFSCPSPLGVEYQLSFRKGRHVLVSEYMAANGCPDLVRARDQRTFGIGGGAYQRLFCGIASALSVPEASLFPYEGHTSLGAYVNPAYAACNRHHSITHRSP